MFAHKHRLNDEGLSRVKKVIRMLIFSYFKGSIVIINLCSRPWPGTFKSAFEASNVVRS